MSNPKNVFNRNIPIKKPRKSVFDLSYDYKSSFNMGQLIPAFFQPVMPSDTFRVQSDVMIRFAPLLAPIMDRVDVRMDFFFVPNRLVCPYWEDFITGGRDGKFSVPLPFIEVDKDDDQFGKNSLWDYFGNQPIPLLENDEKFVIPNVMPLLAYNLIWNEYYRDQSLSAPSEPILDETTGEVIGFSQNEVKSRCFMKDYFTSAQPTPQRGDSVYLFHNPIQFGTDTSIGYDVFHGDDFVYGLSKMEEGKTSPFFMWGGSSDKHFFTDDTTINDFFTIQSVQRWLNNNNTFGGRYIEQLLGHFGVISSDARLQRPEYLGGGKSPIQISEVLQTSSTDVTSAQGSMAGHGFGIARSNSFRRTFEEHGYIIGLLSVTPRFSFDTGVVKEFLKTDRFDFPFPEFANLGEQPIDNRELFIDYTNPDSSEFGYQPRYSEYRTNRDLITGDFRSGNDSLDFWHCGLHFYSLPHLNANFVTIDPDNYSKIFADQDGDTQHIYCDVYNNVQAIRPLPVYPNTSLL